SPLVWRSALALYEDVRAGEGRIEDCVELSGPDDAAREKARAEIARRFSRLARLNAAFQALHEKIASTSKRHVHLRAKLIAELPRLHVKCSQEMRSIPFHAAQWRSFRASLEEEQNTSRIRLWLKTARQGELEAAAAKSALVEANLRLVVSIA